MKIKNNDIGMRTANELNLRVSVGVLVRVLFENPENGRMMIALERTATLREIDDRYEVLVKVKPFGGGVWLSDPKTLKGLIGNFQYDSERSRQEEDFRIYIKPPAWDKIKDVCIEHFKDPGKRIIDSSPDRELAEEFEDSLGMRITKDQYDLKQISLIFEDLPSETNNLRAQGYPTVRGYYIFEALIKSSEIIRMMLSSNQNYSNKNLQEMVWKDVEQGGKGRANAILTLYLDELKDLYSSIPIEKRINPVYIGEHQLDGNVPAIMTEFDHPKYKSYT